MKPILILLTCLFPCFLIASKNMELTIEKSLYDETSEYVSKDDIQKRIKHLARIGILEKFSEILYKNQILNSTALITFTKLGTIENPSISRYSVNSKEIIGIKVFFNYASNAIDYRIIIRAISKTEIEKILNRISGLEFTKYHSVDNKISISNNDSIIIFNFKGQVRPVVFSPKTFFPTNDCDFENNLMLLREYVLSTIGLDNVEADLSNVTYVSLRNKLRKESVVRFKGIDNALNYFLKCKKVSGLEQSIWQYFTSSDSPIDKYIAIWIYQIEAKFNINAEIPLAYLFKNEYISFIQQIDPNENLLYAFIYYKYYVFKNDKVEADIYLKKLKQAGIDKKLL